MSTQQATSPVCAQCGTQIAPSLLACPACGRLVHADRLNELAQIAQDASARADPSAELAAWREALDLLPPGTRQREVVTERVQVLSRTVDAGVRLQPGSSGGSKGVPRWLAGLGAAGAVLWKFKLAIVFVLTKGKLLLLGLTKGTTLLSMLLSLGVYWTMWGWPFALGIVLSIYIHEMGHVATLRRFGFKATAPMFIPGLGALIRLQQHPANPSEDARIGLAGPIWGLGAALAAGALWLATRQPIFAAISSVGAWINLFNLMPVWSLDGGRGFRPMSRIQRWLCVASLAVGGAVVQDGLFVLLFIAAAFRAATDKPDPNGDSVAATQYVGLVGALSALLYFTSIVATSAM